MKGIKLAWYMAAPCLLEREITSLKQTKVSTRHCLITIVTNSILPTLGPNILTIITVFS